MTEIDGYTDLELIGQGGFAVVYKARQSSVGRDVAIKLLTDPAPDDDLVRRFKRESQAVGALSWHPNIAAVVDAGSTHLGHAYIVFELLPGGSLDDRIAHGPMPWAEAVSSMIQVADAVEAAHRADVLHRDIKPANILLDRLGVAKLGDFGIASMQDGNKTETGVLATTVAHAAPELFDGKPASPATDVYALGSTLHTLVTGTPPFSNGEGERIGSVISRIASEPPPRPDPRLVPDQVARVIAHALAKQPQYRLRSAADFGHALQQAQRELGERVTSMPVADSSGAPSAPSPPATPSAPAPPGRAAPLPPVPSVAPPPPPANAPAVAPPVGSLTDYVPLTPSVPAARTAAEPAAKPFTRTIAVLSVIAVLLAIGVGVLLIQQARQAPSAIAVTAGGAEIAAFDALDSTALPAPYGEQFAVDRNPSTYWGVGAGSDGTGIVGTTYVITLTEEQHIVGVGISNGTSTELGRVSSLLWGTSIPELERRGPSARDQLVPDAPGDSPMLAYDATTDRIAVAITGVHGDPAAVGIAEILIEVAPTEEGS